MNEIKQGTIYGLDIVIKVPYNREIDNEIINENTLEKHIRREIKNAIESRWKLQTIEE